MYGAEAYGGTVFGGATLTLPVVDAELLLTFRAVPRVPTWEAIPIGNGVVVVATLLAEGTPVEPSLLTCEIELPRGTLQTPGMTREAEGVWTAALTASQPGRWTCRVQSSGSVLGAAEGVFWVANSELI